MTGSKSVTPSYPERYEDLNSILLDDTIGVASMSDAWRMVCREALAMGSSFGAHMDRHSNDDDPFEGADPVAVDVFGSIATEFRDMFDPQAPIEVAFDPRLFPVFREQPTIRRLGDALVAFASAMLEHRGRPSPATVPEDQREDFAQAIRWVELLRLQAVMQWAHYGRRVYMLGSETASLLARTDLPAMPIDEVSLPFRGFYVRFPRGMYQIANEVQTTSVDGVLVTTNRTDSGTGLDREFKIVVCPDSMLQPGLPLPMAFGVFKPDQSLREVAATLQAELQENSAVLRLHEDTDPIANLVFGFALYLMSEHPHLVPVSPPPDAPDLTQIKNPAKRRKRLQAWAERTRIGYIRIGYEAPQDGAHKVGTPLHHQVWVRGHWRNQAHGTKHQLRKLLWIEPHVRGPDLAEQLEARAARVQDAGPA